MKNLTRVVSAHDLLNELEAVLAGDAIHARPVAEIISDLRACATAPSIQDVMSRPLDFSHAAGELVMRPGADARSALDFAYRAMSTVEGALTSAVSNGTEVCADMADVLALRLRPAAVALAVAHQTILDGMPRAAQPRLRVDDARRAA